MDAARFQEPRRWMAPIRSRWGSGDMAVLDFGDPTRAPDVVFLHANGFNAQTYRTALAPLSGALRIIAPDLRGHGGSTLPTRLRGRRSWADFRDDILALLEHLDAPPVTLAGHSMGATVALLAADRPQARVANLVLFDPVVFGKAALALFHLPGATALARRRAPVARGALRRRDRFESRAAALAAYRGRGAFAGWPEAMLADYVAAGFEEGVDGEVRLTCAPHWEASNFVSQANRPWRALARSRRPALILKAASGSTCALTQAQAAGWPLVRVEVAPGDHFFPMRRPDLVRDRLLEAAT